MVEIDTTGGPGFGSQHFKTLDFLRDHEVVFTFDDGPWLNTTPAVLKALADQCLRATFFPIGKHSTYYPDILKQDVAGGPFTNSGPKDFTPPAKNHDGDGDWVLLLTASAVNP